MTSPTPIAWSLAVAGSLCLVSAAYLAGGRNAALGALGSALLGAAGVFGWKANATPPK